jgi:hypothetical protein
MRNLTSAERHELLKDMWLPEFITDRHLSFLLRLF